MACCAFHGHISEIPNISIDNFTNKDVSFYFLSHSHTDHTQGLYDPSFIQTLKTNGAFIYMSEMSAAIVKYEVKSRLGKYGDVEEISKRIRILGIGDFRTSVNDVSKFGPLHDNGNPITIDALYVDTTFFDDKYCTFPKRSESVTAALSEIERWLKRDGNRVAIKTSAKFGYEYVFNALFKKLGVKVHVEEVRWKELYSLFTHLVPGVTNEMSPVHLCWPKNRRDHTKCTPDGSTDQYLNIHLSAQKWAYFQIDDNPICKISDNEIDVCFSTHCSKSELMYFINYFKPKRIVGFPNRYDSPVNDFVPAKKARMDMKLDKKVLREIFDI